MSSQIDGFRRHRFRLRSAAAGTALLALLSNGCNSNTPSQPSPGTSLNAVVADPAGDPVVRAVLRNGVQVFPNVPVPPDLIAATVDVTAGTLTITVTYAPFTLSQRDTITCLLMDTDQNSQTGAPAAPGDVVLGYDYSLCGVSPRASTIAQVSRLGGIEAVPVGTGTLTFPGPDQVRMSAPMSMLGNGPGRMSFKVSSAQWQDPEVFNTDPLDWMPDLGQPAAVLR